MDPEGLLWRGCFGVGGWGSMVAADFYSASGVKEPGKELRRGGGGGRICDSG